jgi:hypothetical protein
VSPISHEIHHNGEVVEDSDASSLHAAVGIRGGLLVKRAARIRIGIDLITLIDEGKRKEGSACSTIRQSRLPQESLQKIGDTYKLR